MIIEPVSVKVGRICLRDILSGVMDRMMGVEEERKRG